jgi:bacillithiol biosynthesis cysteine-adding enzyme BshC
VAKEFLSHRQGAERAVAVSGIFEAYLAGAARSFFGGHFSDPDDRRRAVLRAARPLATRVFVALDAQNARLATSRAREGNLDALRRGAAAVVTGQQVGLFLGPLFTVYKAASAIRAAKALAEESGRPVVPVFWLQTEDHDLPEIASCHVPCAHGAALALELPASPADRVSIAHRALPAEVASCLARLGAEIAHLPQGEAHLERLGRYYRPGAGWGEAFAGVLAEIFADDGLVVIDPRDGWLAAAAAPVHHRALTDAVPLAEALAQRGHELEAAGFAPTVHVRPAAPLSFFHPEGAQGPRFRLETAGGGFREVGGNRTYPLEGLLDALAAEPLRFSTSALLRPILQDTFLPTAAYVGGPAEVAYFAQLAPLYAAYDIPFPLIVPRARFRILEEKTLRLLERLRIGADDAARPDDELLAAAANADGASADREAVARKLLAPFDAALGELQRGSGHLDIDGAVAKTRAAVETAVARLARKVERARQHRDQTLVDDVRRVKQLLFPNGAPQERVYGLSYFAGRYGERAFVERVLAAVDPFDPSPKDLVLNDEIPAADADPSIAATPRRR